MATNIVEYVLNLKTKAAEGNLNDLEHDLEELIKRLKEVDKESGKAGDGLDETSSPSKSAKFKALRGQIALVVGALTAVATATFGFAKKVVDLVNELNDLSVRSGVATDTIQALQQSLVASGQSTEGLNEILGAISGQFSQLTKQGSEVEKKFNSFGIAIRNSNGDLRSNNDILLDVISQLQGIDDASERSRRAVFLLGESGAKLNQALASGDFNDFLQFTREFGVNTGEKASAQAAKFQSSLSSLSVVFNGLLQQLGDSTGIIDRVQQSIIDVGSAFAFAKSFVSSLSPAVRQLSNFFIDLLLGGKPLIDLFPALKNVIGDVGDEIDSQLTGTIDKFVRTIFGDFADSIFYAIDLLKDLINSITVFFKGYLGFVGKLIIPEGVQKAIDDATASVERFRESADRLPTVRKTTNAITNGMEEVSESVSSATEEVRTLLDVLLDLAGISINPDQFISDMEIISQSIQGFATGTRERFTQLFDKLKSDMLKFTEIFGQASRDLSNDVAEEMATDTLTFGSEKFLDRLYQSFLVRTRNTMNSIKGMFQSLDEFTGGKLSNVAQGISGVLSKVGTKFGSSISSAIGGISSSVLAVIGPIMAVLGIAKKLGSMARSDKEIREMQKRRREEGKSVTKSVIEVQQKDIEKNLERQIKGTAKAIELGLQVLPRVLFDVLPPLLIETADRVVFGFFKGIAELINVVKNIIGTLFNREQRRELAKSIIDGLKQALQEFARRLGVLGGIVSKRSGGRYIPSARGGIKFTGADEGLALLHRGEFVVPETGQMPQSVQRTMGSMGGSVVININSQVIESNAIDELVRQIERRFQTFGTTTSPLFGGR